MNKKKYLDLVSDAYDESDLIGVRHAAESDLDLAWGEIAEINKAIDRKSEDLREVST